MLKTANFRYLALHLLRGLFPFSYLEKEHMSHCVPSNISSGLFNRPLKYVYIDGKPDFSQPTVRNLSSGEILSGPQAYASMLSYFITTDMTPDEVYNKGWEILNQTYPQVLKDESIISVGIFHQNCIRRGLCWRRRSRPKFNGIG